VRDGPGVIVRELHREGPVGPLEDAHDRSDGARGQAFVGQRIDECDGVQELHGRQPGDPLRYRVFMFAFWSSV